MLVAVDASALEWRTLLQLSQDPVGMQEVVDYLSGKDPLDVHLKNQQHFKLPERVIAKRFLFRTIYKGSGWAFARDPEFTHVSSDPKYWDNLNEEFYKKYSVIDSTHKAWWEIVKNGNPIIGPTGRSWTIDIVRTNHGELKIPWTTLTNYPVQGTGADVMMIARISFYRRLKLSGLPVLVVSTVHDSIVVDVEDQYISQVVNLFYQVFDDLALNMSRTFKMDWNVPLGCECKFGKDLLHMEKIGRTDK